MNPSIRLSRGVFCCAGRMKLMLRRCAMLILLVGWFSGLRADEAKFFAGLGPIAPEASLSLKTGSQDWYKDAVVYHLWVAAYRDSDKDGVGDIKGITESLDTIKDLGINCI